jgi:hypothetical protein
MELLWFICVASSLRNVQGSLMSLTTQSESWERKIWSWVPRGLKPRSDCNVEANWNVAVGRASYSEGLRFKSRLEDRMSWNFSWSFSAHPVKFWDSSQLKRRPRSLLPTTFPINVFINQCTIQCHMVWIADSKHISKWILYPCIKVTEQVVLEVELKTCIWEDLGRISTRTPAILANILPGSPQSFQANIMIVHQLCYGRFLPNLGPLAVFWSSLIYKHC